MSPSSDREEANRRLVAAQFGVLATITPDGSPHAVPITFAVVDDLVVTAVDHKPKRSTRLQRIVNLETDALGLSAGPRRPLRLGPAVVGARRPERRPGDRSRSPGAGAGRAGRQIPPVPGASARRDGHRSANRAHHRMGGRAVSVAPVATLGTHDAAGGGAIVLHPDRRGRRHHPLLPRRPHRLSD